MTADVAAALARHEEAVRATKEARTRQWDAYAEVKEAIRRHIRSNAPLSELPLQDPEVNQAFESVIEDLRYEAKGVMPSDA